MEFTEGNGPGARSRARSASGSWRRAKKMAPTTSSRGDGWISEEGQPAVLDSYLEFKELTGLGARGSKRGRGGRRNAGSEQQGGDGVRRSGKGRGPRGRKTNFFF